MTDSQLLTNLHSLPFVAVSMSHNLFPDHVERFIIVPRCVYNSEPNAHGCNYVDISVKDWHKLEREPNFRQFEKNGIRFIEPSEIKKRMDYFIALKQIKPFSD